MDLKLFMVKANRNDYDQYDSAIVWARSPEDAVKAVIDTLDDGAYGPSQIWSATELDMSPVGTGIVLASFNAG
jgi:hypothetical protein